MLRTLLILLTLSLLGATSALAAKFDHAAHNTYLEPLDCSACHVTGAKSIVPDLKVCLDCHDQAFVKDVEFSSLNTHGPVWALNHRAAAKGNTPDCSACHHQSDCLACHKAGFADEMGAFGNQMVNVHRSDFGVTHPIAARNNQQLCASCHETKFCNDCHASFGNRIGRPGSPSHSRVFDLGLNGNIDTIHAGMSAAVNCDSCHTPGAVTADFHSWSSNHAREARKSLPTCQACHPEGDVCLRCHSAKGGVVGFNPHGKDWDKRKNRLNDASNGKTCKQCH